MGESFPREPEKCYLQKLYLQPFSKHSNHPGPHQTTSPLIKDRMLLPEAQQDPAGGLRGQLVLDVHSRAAGGLTPVLLCTPPS